MKDAIVSPMITIALSPSSNMSAIPMSTIAQIPLTIRDFFKSASPLNQSMIVEEAKELIDELNVDMAADRIPANNNPFTPMGKCSIIKVENSRSLSISTPPR